ncbi:MAG TPA: hypothetical protein VIM67_09470 [Terriglobus sp.]
MPDVEQDPRQPELHLRGFTYVQRQVLMPELGVSIDHAGGWVLQRRTLAANALELVLESQSLALPDVYGAFLACGVELTRESHRALAQQCLCMQHLPQRRGVAAIVLMFVEIQFLDGIPEAFERVSSFAPKGALA